MMDTITRLLIVFFMAIGIWTTLGWIETRWTDWRREKIRQSKPAGLITQLNPDAIAPEKLEPAKQKPERSDAPGNESDGGVRG